MRTEFLKSEVSEEDLKAPGGDGHRVGSQLSLQVTVSLKEESGRENRSRCVSCAVSADPGTVIYLAGEGRAGVGWG